MSASLSRRLAAEAPGSCLLAATIIGSGILAVNLSGGNDGVALLGNTLATAAILYVLVGTLGPVSGAHLNPAVTLVAALRGDIRPAEAVAYAARSRSPDVLPEPCWRMQCSTLR